MLYREPICSGSLEGHLQGWDMSPDAVLALGLQGHHDGAQDL